MYRTARSIAGVVVLAGGLVLGGTASATATPANDHCQNGFVCYWAGDNYTGAEGIILPVSPNQCTKFPDSPQPNWYALSISNGGQYMQTAWANDNCTGNRVWVAPGQENPALNLQALSVGAAS